MLALAISAALLVPVLAAAPVANAAPNGAPYDFDGNGQADMAVWVPGELVAHKTNAGAVNVIYGRKGGLSRKNNQFWTQGSNGVQDSPEIDDRFGATLASGDFNNDNRADLAIGVPGEDVNGVSDAGAVEVIYGTPNGLRVTLEQFFTQETPGIGGFPRPEDLFAGALAAGDFNGDGFDDLVVGSPGEDVNGKAAAGSIVAIYGSGTGLDPAVSDEWTQTTSGAGQTQAGDRFGAALAVADFGSGTRDDLAIGVPREKVRKKDSAGAVVAMYGSASGLDPTGHQLWDQGGHPLQGDPGPGDRFGSTLAAGNLGHGSTNDLAVGIPGENRSSGGVGVIFGKPSGLAGEKDELWTQATKGIPGDPGSDHCFGCALAIGNVGMGKLRDLAIGARGQRIGKGQGAVYILFGTNQGLRTRVLQYWGKQTNGVPGQGTSSDAFGGSLIAANFGEGSFDDIAMGDPSARVGGAASAGSETVLYGKKDGLTTRGSQLWTQDSKRIKDQAEPFDDFSQDRSVG